MKLTLKDTSLMYLIFKLQGSSWEIYLCYWMRRLNIIKMSIIPSLSSGPWHPTFVWHVIFIYFITGSPKIFPWQHQLKFKISSSTFKSYDLTYHTVWMRLFYVTHPGAHSFYMWTCETKDNLSTPKL